MSRTQSQKLIDRQNRSQGALARSFNDSFEEFDGNDSAESKEKDATELELEKLVFGDEVGFYDGLKLPTAASIPGSEDKAKIQVEDDEYEGIEEGLEGVDDADVRTWRFVLDGRYQN